MKILISVIFIILSVFIQSSFFPYLQVFNAFPNLILIAVLIISLLKNYKESLVWVFLGGWFLDVYSFNNPLGTSILSLLFIGYLVNFLSVNLFKKSSIISLVTVCVISTIIYRLALALAFLITTGDLKINIVQILAQIIYNLIIFIPAFYIIKSKTRTSF